MRTRLITPIVLMIFLCGNAVLFADDTVNEKQKPAEGDSTSAVMTPADTSVSSNKMYESEKIIAYYFHGTRRCATCKKLEAYSKEAIETGSSNYKCLRAGRNQ